MRRSQSGCLSSQHVLDAQEATHRYQLIKLFERELLRIQVFQSSIPTHLATTLSHFQTLLSQQTTALQDSLLSQCDLISHRLQTLLHRINKDKRVFQMIPELEHILHNEHLLQISATSDWKEFKIENYVKIDVKWTDKSQFLSGKSAILTVKTVKKPSISRQTHLDLSNQGTNSHDLRSLLPHLSVYSSLQTLDLSYSVLDKPAIQTLGVCLKGFGSLEKVVLKGNTIDGGLLKTLCGCCGVKNTVKLLDLDENRLGSSLKDLENCLSQAFPALESIILRRNQLIDCDLQAVCQDLVHLLNLHTVDFAANKVTDAGIKAFARILPHFPALISIDFSENPINDAGALSLSRTLCECTRMTAVNLQDTGITWQGAEQLQEAGREMLWLETLLVAGRNLVGEGRGSRAKYGGTT